MHLWNAHLRLWSFPTSFTRVSPAVVFHQSYFTGWAISNNSKKALHGGRLGSSNCQKPQPTSFHLQQQGETKWASCAGAVPNSPLLHPLCAQHSGRCHSVGIFSLLAAPIPNGRSWHHHPPPAAAGSHNSLLWTEEQVCSEAAPRMSLWFNAIWARQRPGKIDEHILRKGTVWWNRWNQFLFIYFSQCRYSIVAPVAAVTCTVRMSTLLELLDAGKTTTSFRDSFPPPNSWPLVG